jgi:DNA-binding LacI/PurR family transcriptional regulator
LSLIQKTDGLTFGTDALLLASYVSGKYDLGCEFGGGTGIISLLLVSRQKLSKAFAIEVQEEYAELIKRNAVPSVIVAGYDQIAYGAMREARAAGYGIPEAISFVGMDDIPTSRYGEIQLSSLYIDFESACPKIVELIYKRIENRYYRAREQINIPVKLNVRGSLLNKNK